MPVEYNWQVIHRTVHRSLVQAAAAEAEVVCSNHAQDALENENTEETKNEEKKAEETKSEEKKPYFFFLLTLFLLLFFLLSLFLPYFRFLGRLEHGWTSRHAPL